MRWRKVAAKRYYYKEEIVVDIQKTHQKENNSREREKIKFYLLLPRSLGGTIQIMSDK